MRNLQSVCHPYAGLVYIAAILYLRHGMVSYAYSPFTSKNMNPFERKSDQKKIRTIGEFLLDRRNGSKSQSGYVAVVETTGSSTRRTAVKKALKEQEVEHLCLLKSYSEAMRLMSDERNMIADLMGEKAMDSNEVILQCRLVFLSITDLADAPRAIETVKELRSHPRFRGAVIVVDFPNMDGLTQEEQSRHGQIIALAKEAKIEASVVSQNSENITKMIEAALGHINEKLTDSTFKKLIDIGENILERKNDPQAADIALSTFQYSRVQELLSLMDKMAEELKGESKVMEVMDSKKKEALAMVREIQSTHDASNPDTTGGFQKVIDLLKEVVLDLKEKHAFKADARNTYAPRRLVGEGRAYQLKKNYRKAEEYFLMALKMMEGKFINALIALADLYHETMETEKETAVLERAIGINPHNIQRLALTAGLHAKSGDKKRAKELVERALREDPEIAAMPAGEVYLELGDSQKAQELFEKSMKRECLSPEDHFHALNRVAISLRKQKKYDEAVKNYQKAMKIFPDDPVVHYNMGMVCMRKHENKEAMHCFKKALELNPNFVEVKTAIEKLRKTLGDHFQQFTTCPD